MKIYEKPEIEIVNLETENIAYNDGQGGLESLPGGYNPGEE